MKICDTCHGGCCRNYTVGLTGYDILNIANTLKVHPCSFVDVLPVEEGADFEHKSKHTAIFQFSDMLGYYVLGMKMVESVLVPSTAKCQFLMEWNSDNENPTLDGIIARCGIYSCRPLICAAFPTKLSEDELFAQMINVSAFEQQVAHPIYRSCPEPPSCEDITDADDIVKTLVFKKFEVDFFKNLATEWNKSPKTMGEFWDFLSEFYQNRVVIV